MSSALCASLKGRGRARAKGPAGKGTARPGLLCLPLPGRPVSYRKGLAVGAFEAPIEHARADFALVLALEQSAVAALVAPTLARLLGRAVKDHPVVFDAVDVGAAQGVVRAAAFRVALGQDDPVAGDAVDGADMLVIIADDF